MTPLKNRSNTQKHNKIDSNALFSYFNCMKLSLLTILLIISQTSLGQLEIDELHVRIPIKWDTAIVGDFSFKDKWHYPEGVYVNQWGQLSCDGLCPPEIDRMKGPKGKLIEDSLEAFYSIIDTTHIYYSLSCNVKHAFEYGDAYDASCQQNEDHLLYMTHGTVSTHCGMIWIIDTRPQAGDSIGAYINLNSIIPGGDRLYQLISGEVKIDPVLLEQGILKAQFDLVFENDHEEHPTQSWKGLTYVPIKREKSIRIR